MRDTWDIADPEAALEMARTLLDGLDAPDYDPLLAHLAPARHGLPDVVHEAMRVTQLRLAGTDSATLAGQFFSVINASHYLPAVLPPSILSWDLSRLVVLSRQVVGAGYLHEDQLWPLLFAAAERSRETYVGWSDYALGVELGHALSVAGGDPVAADEALTVSRPVIAQLLGDPGSPWLRLSFR